MEYELAALPPHARTPEARTALAHYAAALEGSMARSEAAASILKEQAASRYDLPTSLLPLANWSAPLLINLGVVDACFEVIDFVADCRESWGHIDHFTLCFLWKARARFVREDARFSQFVERMEMLPYWEKYGPPDGHRLSGGKLLCL
jgi:hypothetical protein